MDEAAEQCGIALLACNNRSDRLRPYVRCGLQRDLVFPGGRSLPVGCLDGEGYASFTDVISDAAGFDSAALTVCGPDWVDLVSPTRES